MTRRRIIEAERRRQLTKLIETGSEKDKLAIEQERRSGHGLRLRQEAEEMARRAGL